MSAHGSTKVVLAALAGNLAIAACKGVGAALTGSAAMLSEAAHSVADSGNQLLLLIGMKRAARAADDQHPFGYHREIYFWAFVVALVLFTLGGGVAFREGWEKFWHPQAEVAFTFFGLTVPAAAVNLAILGIGAVVEGASFRVAYKEFSAKRGSQGFIAALRQSTDPAVFVVLFEDAAALLGLLVAFVGVVAAELTGLAWIDGLASMVIGAILFGTAGFLMVETASLLIGESADKAVVSAIRQLAKSMQGVINVNEVATLQNGPHAILALVSIDLEDTLNAGYAEFLTTKLERAIKAAHPDVNRVYIEVQNKADSASIAAEAAAQRAA